ncbi:hypothetical protein Acsp03_63210 [Actinomadura sp. NBRC 104412]|nr:hypothetical protein Acsp03_63210 [Actinomadura sp. NBRC 104412]
MGGERETTHTGNPITPAMRPLILDKSDIGLLSRPEISGKCPAEIRQVAKTASSFPFGNGSATGDGTADAGHAIPYLGRIRNGI